MTDNSLVRIGLFIPYLRPEATFILQSFEKVAPRCRLVHVLDACKCRPTEVPSNWVMQAHLPSPPQNTQTDQPT